MRRLFGEEGSTREIKGTAAKRSDQSDKVDATCRFGALSGLGRLYGPL